MTDVTATLTDLLKQADTAHLEHGAVEGEGGDLTADEGDHRVLTG